MGMWARVKISVLRPEIRAKFVTLEIVIKLIRVNEATKEENTMGEKKRSLY